MGDNPFQAVRDKDATLNPEQRERRIRNIREAIKGAETAYGRLVGCDCAYAMRMAEQLLTELKGRVREIEGSGPVQAPLRPDPSG